MKMPKQIFVYVCDHERDGTPIPAIAIKVEDIPEDQCGEKIGHYTLADIKTLEVKRELR